MSCIIWKSFNLSFSKFKCFPTIAFSPPPADDGELDQAHEVSADDPSILKNFNSLYDPSSCGSDHDILSTPKYLPFSSSTTTTTDDILSSSSGEESVPDFTSAFATNRFFVSSPGSTNSIFGSTPLEPMDEKEDSVTVVSGGVAVETYSPDPYSDFRKSMVEMIEARDPTTTDWEFLIELLLCYLSLNTKHTHKFIVGAFSDIIVSLVLPPEGCRNSSLM